MRVKSLRFLAAVMVLTGCMLSHAFAQDTEKSLTVLPRQFASTAFGQAGRAAGKNFGVAIYITDWTTDQQVKDFLGVLKEKGPDALVSAMDKTKDVGRVAPTGYVGNGLRFARYRKTANGGLHIVMVTDRRMSFGELYNSTRSTDYPFSVIVLDVDKAGKGTGKLAPVVKIKFNKKGELEVENYGIEPFRLANVYLQQ